MACGEECEILEKDVPFSKRKRTDDDDESDSDGEEIRYKEEVDYRLI